jgi:hypothetical protein
MRFPHKDFTDPYSKAKWLQFIPDKSVGKIKNDWEGGFLRIRIFVGLYGDNEDSMGTGGWNAAPSPPPATAKMLMCNLY